MKRRNKKDINIDIEENNYSIYRSLLDEYTALKENKHSKFNPERNIYKVLAVDFFITILAILNVFAPLSIPTPLFFVALAATFIDTIIKIVTNENRIKEELSKRYPNLITDLDYLELSKKVHQYEWSKQIRRTREDIASIMDEINHALYEDLVEKYATEIEQNYFSEEKEPESKPKKLELVHKDTNENK